MSLWLRRYHQFANVSEYVALLAALHSTWQAHVVSINPSHHWVSKPFFPEIWSSDLVPIVELPRCSQNRLAAGCQLWPRTGRPPRSPGWSGVRPLLPLGRLPLYVSNVAGCRRWQYRTVERQLPAPTYLHIRSKAVTYRRFLTVAELRTCSKYPPKRTLMAAARPH